MFFASRSKPWITNFGRNVRFQTRDIFRPRDEQELLAILTQVRGRKIRVVGRLHSWSRLVVSEDVLIDMRHLNSVRIERRGDQNWAVIGAGCQVKRALSELESQAGMTLPAVGLITEQSLVGAAATGTHGSGKHSISHYIDEVRLAAYDPKTGAPVIRTILDGPELRAARCSLGCLGVVVSVGLRCIPQYSVEDHFRRYRTLDHILAAETEYPLQQFYFLPWLWEFYAQHRRVVPKRRSLLSWVYLWYTFLIFDVAFHWVIAVLARWIPLRSWTRCFFRRIVPWTVVQKWRAVGKSQAMLVMEHELFRHVEVELFVKRHDLPAALDLIKATLQYLDGAVDAFSASLQQRLETLDLWHLLAGQNGSYTHHYLTSIRRVLPDDTLMSMASGEGADFYALSLITYARPGSPRRDQFLKLAEFLTQSMTALFGARPHWGKICSITGQQAERLYPGLAEFRRIVREYDPGAVFRNDWVDQTLFDEAASPGISTGP